MKNQLLFLLTLFLFSHIGHGQTLEIHQMAVGNADSGVIVIRDTTAVLNILRKDVARGLLSFAEYTAFKSDLLAVKFNEVKAPWAYPVFIYILALQKLDNSQRTELQNALSSAGFNPAQPVLSVLATKLQSLFGKAPAFQDSYNLVANFIAGFRNLFVSADNRINMTQKVIDKGSAVPDTLKPEYDLTGTVLESVVIDAGREGNATTFIVDYLKSQGITVINKFILSHYHDDHFGGFKGVYNGMSNINVKRTYEPGVTYFDPGAGGKFKTTYREPMKDALLINSLGDFEFGQNTKRVSRMPGDTVKLVLNDIQMKCVASNSFVAGDPNFNKTNKRGGKNANDYSLAWVIKYKNFKYFTGGDLSGFSTIKINISKGKTPKYKPVCSNYNDIETSLAAKLPAVDIMNGSGHVCSFKVSHHGSRCSSNRAFLDVLSARVAVIPNGKDNKHSNPDPETLQRLDSANGSPEIYAVGLMETLSRGRVFPSSGEINRLQTANKLFVTGNTVVVVSDYPTGPASKFIVKWDGALNLEADEDKDQMIEPLKASNKTYTCTH